MCERKSQWTSMTHPFLHDTLVCSCGYNITMEPKPVDLLSCPTTSLHSVVLIFPPHCGARTETLRPVSADEFKRGRDVPGSIASIPPHMMSLALCLCFMVGSMGSTSQGRQASGTSPPTTFLIVEFLFLPLPYCARLVDCVMCSL